MVETAGCLVDPMPPRAPVRQWVLSFPLPLRSLFAVCPELLAPMRRIVHRAIHTHLIKQTKREREQAASGAITLPSVLAAWPISIRICTRVLDGVYQTGADEGAPAYISKPKLQIRGLSFSYDHESPVIFFLPCKPPRTLRQH